MTSIDFAPVADVLRQAGDLILDWRHDKAQRRLHSVRDFKTQADARAHEWISDRLAGLYPGLPVLSEEAEWKRSRPSAYWLIDPIDGTASWYEGYSGFATQAAFIDRGMVLYGVVCAPALGVVWEGISGKGAWRNGESLPRLVPSDRLLVCDNYPDARRAARTLVDRLPATGYVESGSLGIKCCLIADGTADVFVKDVVTRDWDIAPAAPVLAAVGAVLSLPNGAPYLFDGAMEKPEGVLVARDPELAARAVGILEKP
ncbi:inositol monophosphatase family protein [Bordetella genomosp. 13]|uniref:3'(2'),5'-bisphosphate nucleotidase CysQ n=1 Tax=Bordetella genomosp. 13 TaxID=463040 RepID=A0A1W6Z9M5_9BORD|nr:inositol monophosphatase family protein [Bordetella genomosp. 13]ARP94073.1 hypothetical protein CAL15_06555 [Bordetella genomosp. 13]